MNHQDVPEGVPDWRDAEIARLRAENKLMRDDPDSAFDAIDERTAQIYAVEQERDALRAEVERLKRERDEARAETLAAIGSDGSCLMCGEATDSRAADPGRWPLWFTEPDGTGRARPHHVRCVQSRLAENARLRRVAEAARALLATLPRCDDGRNDAPCCQGVAVVAWKGDVTPTFCDECAAHMRAHFASQGLHGHVVRLTDHPSAAAVRALLAALEADRG